MVRFSTWKRTIGLFPRLVDVSRHDDIDILMSEDESRNI